MILTQLFEGLGNQMFQYAAGKTLALRLGRELVLDLTWFRPEEQVGKSPFGVATPSKRFTPRKFGLTAFDLPERTVVNAIANRRIDGAEIELYYEPEFGCYDSAVEHLEDQTALIGYWQSERYFGEAESAIRRCFKFPALDGRNSKLLRDIKDGRSVSVHVRRTDYLLSAEHRVLGFDYYRTAMEYIETIVENPRFFFFSDDPDWCSRHLVKSSADVVITGNGKPGQEFRDMQLMGLCDNNIIANSTFSWWGAWLNPNVTKTVVAPKGWFAVKPVGLGIAATRDHDNTEDGSRVQHGYAPDLVPASWLLV